MLLSDLIRTIHFSRHRRQRKLLGASSAPWDKLQTLQLSRGWQVTTTSSPTCRMEISQGSRAQGLPEIFVQDSNRHERYRTLSRSSSYNSAASPTSIPMSIPNSREPVPPPLPPPRHLADIASGGDNGPDIAWKWGNLQENSHGWGGSQSSSVAPGSSLLGGSFLSRNSSFMDERPDFFRRQSSTATIKSSRGMPDARDNSYSRDEGYASLSGTSIGSNLLVPNFLFSPVSPTAISGSGYAILE